MEYIGDRSEFGNFQLNPTDEVPTEISNRNEELLNTCLIFDLTVPEMNKKEKFKITHIFELPKPKNMT